MSRSIDNILDAHHIATQRRNSGQPVWSITLQLGHLFHNAELTREQRRDGIVAAIRASRWPAITGEPDELAELLEELGDTDGPQWFDAVWNRFYDLANIDRVWIVTWGDGQ